VGNDAGGGLLLHGISFCCGLFRFVYEAPVGP
jgi:hypothetical protein